MAWDGSGNFTRTKDWTNDRDGAIKILATRHDENDDELATGIQACLTRNNETKPTADFRPNADDSYSLGSSALRWVNAWFKAAKVKTATYTATVQSTNLTGDRTIELPDAAGTLGIFPPGLVAPYAGSSAPSGWLLCDGAAVSRTTYAALFAIIGTTYGSGDGSTTFNTPDLTGRVVAGKESSETRLTTAVCGINGGTLGAAGGDQRLHQHTHTATVTDPGHVHQVDSFAVAGAGGSSVGVTSGTKNTAGSTTGITVSNANAGAGSSQNVQPTIVLNYLIKT